MNNPQVSDFFSGSEIPDSHKEIFCLCRGLLPAPTPSCWNHEQHTSHTFFPTKDCDKVTTSSSLFAIVPPADLASILFVFEADGQLISSPFFPSFGPFLTPMCSDTCEEWTLSQYSTQPGSVAKRTCCANVRL